MNAIGPRTGDLSGVSCSSEQRWRGSACCRSDRDTARSVGQTHLDAQRLTKPDNSYAKMHADRRHDQGRAS